MHECQRETSSAEKKLRVSRTEPASRSIRPCGSVDRRSADLLLSLEMQDAGKLTEEGERRSVRDRPHDRHELQSPGVKKSVDMYIESEAIVP